MTSITYCLPFPPSTNTAFYTDFKNRTRHKSKKAREWEQDALRELLIQPKYKMQGDEKLRVCMVFNAKWLNKDGSIYRSDVANREKICIDLLVKHIPGFKDEMIFDLTLRKNHSTINTVNIFIEEL